jgi:microcystin degradation protein MlrC
VRLALAGLSHESNTFAPVAADLGQWQRARILTGDEIRAAHATAQSIVAGYLAYSGEQPDVEVVPLVYSELTPMGASTAEAFDYLTARIVTSLRDGGPWDGVLMPLHGAAVSERLLDADGELIDMVRAAVGPDVPIAATLDMHANVSLRMIAAADVVTMFQTNPHVDAFDQGLASARLLGRMIRGEIRPTLALATPPLVVNILRQGTDDEPMAGILRVAREHERRPGVLAVFVSEGFPYADVPEMGMSVVAVTDGNEQRARPLGGGYGLVAQARTRR